LTLRALLTIATVLCAAAAPSSADAQSIALLPTAFGDAEPALPDSLDEALRTSFGDALLGAAELASRIRARRPPTPAPIDEAALAAAVELGEQLYFEAQLQPAVAHLEGGPLLALDGAVEALALQPEAGSLFRRGSLAAARALTDLGETARAEAWMERSIRHFPTWTATTEWYPPSFVARYLALRADLAARGPALSVTGPEQACEVWLNGLLAAPEVPAQLELPPGRYALWLRCAEAGEGALRLVETATGVAEPLTVHLDPRLDAGLDAAGTTLRLGREDVEDPELLASLARAWGDLVGATEVVLVGPLDTHPAWTQWVEAEGLAGAPPRLVRVPTPSPDADPEALATWVAAARGRAPCGDCLVFADGAWVPQAADPAPPPPPALTEGAPPRWTYWLAGVAGATAVGATVLGVVEAGTADDLAACRRDPRCDGSAREADLAQSGRWQSIGATVSVVASALALTAAVVGWLGGPGGDEAGQAPSAPDGLSWDWEAIPSGDGARIVWGLSF
jgi:hypothetical protein